MKSILFTLLFVYGCYSSILAQDDLADYRQAKQLISNRDFVQAMNLLTPYLDYDAYGELADYANYYFARAAYENQQYQLAQNRLEQIIKDRDWEHQDDAKYLLALSHFQQQDISEALKEIGGIRDGVILEEAYRASYNFLQPISTSVLIVNLPNYHKNEGLVRALRNQLAKRTYLSAKEQNVYDQIKELNFSEEVPSFTRKLNETLEVAVVLPFNYNGGSGVKRLEDNNFVFELYKGIKFAADEAKNQGIPLVIKTFDTERKAEVLNRILGDPFFQLADIIVGPIYPEESEIVARFAEERKIPFINPLSNILDERATLDYSYLFRPSVDNITEEVLIYNKKLPGRRIAVAYSETIRDEMLAKRYGDLASRMGFQIVTNKKVDTKDMRSFLEDISKNSGNGRNIDQIVIFSDDPNIASPTFAVMESLTSEIPVLVMDSWLYFNFANYEMLDIQNFHFVGNNTINVNKDEVVNFRAKFFERFNAFPDLNSHLGYEIIHWISRIINNKEGFDFQKNLDKEGFHEGTLTFGFDFRNKRSNNYVPILRLEQGVLETE